MRQLVGCATCARVKWIDQCFPCHLFKDCPEALRPCEDDSDDETAAPEDEEEQDDARDNSREEQSPQALSGTRLAKTLKKNTKEPQKEPKTH